MRKWESRSDLQHGPAAGFSTTQLATTIHAFRMAGLEVTLYGRFWVTPEDIFTPVKVDLTSEEAGPDESLHGEHAYEEI